MLAFIFGIIIGAFGMLLLLGLCVCASDSDEMNRQWDWEEENRACYRCLRPLEGKEKP